MSLNSKPAWLEGMFIKPQNFQQQDRYTENLLRENMGVVSAYPYGLSQLRIDRALLPAGKLSLARVRGVFEDGTTFNAPHGDELPEPLGLKPNTKNQIVYLAVPLRTAGNAEVGQADSPLQRYHSIIESVVDNASEAQESADIPVAKLKLQLKLGSDDLSRFSTLAVARIREIKEDGTVVLDEDFIPSVANFRASSVLVSYVKEVASFLEQKIRLLSPTIGDLERSRNLNTVSNMLLMQSMNRYLPIVDYYSQIKYAHPEAIYLVLSQLLGELSTYNPSARGFEPVAKYQHKTQNESFDPVIDALRILFTMLMSNPAILIDLLEDESGVYQGRLFDKAVLNRQFILSIKATGQQSHTADQIAQHIKISTPDRIRDLIPTQVPGVKLNALPTAPPQVPYHSGWHYFELDVDSEAFRSILNQRQISIHVSGQFETLQLQLLAIKE